ncbi:prepilin-type N-terminal cleavage/methylation domain-containing protein [Limisalsivibrio acetivorans]|uniref:prepilin-type N-terminal cleavage/methylation domain-containing protein n=1 Tax=Limisalsivibrio acetivorans TaxID=1304888 RepID=UPI0003B3F9E5|nr:prepilin-type N-terminal cleavage/methylation domain-containing protein [Limisalsivibrio acetivorans]
MSSRRGFTIVEMAVVLIIIGVVISLGIYSLSSLQRGTKSLENEQEIDRIFYGIMEESIMDRELPSTVAETDKFGRDILYIPAPAIAGSESVCNIHSTGLNIISGGRTVNNVAYLLISGGENRNIQTGTISPITVYNHMSVSVDDYPADVDSAETYDDNVRWATLPELRKRAGCSAERLRIVTDSIPKGAVDKAYSATFKAAGGRPYSNGEYNWCAIVNNPLVKGDLGLNDCTDNSDFTKTRNYTVSGTLNLSKPGSYSIRVYVQDNGTDNTDALFPLVINPEYIASVSSPQQEEDEGGDGGGDSDIAFTDFNQLSRFEEPGYTRLDVHKEEGASPEENTLRILSDGNNNAFSCTWYPDSFQLYSLDGSINNTMISYFEAAFTDDPDLGGGFTYAVIAGDYPETTPCGNKQGGDLGYDNNHDGPESFAIEFDLESESSNNDPLNAENHAAVVHSERRLKMHPSQNYIRNIDYYWTNLHTFLREPLGGTFLSYIPNDDCSLVNVEPDACFYEDGEDSWLVDNSPFRVRVEVYPDIQPGLACTKCLSPNIDYPMGPPENPNDDVYEEPVCTEVFVWIDKAMDSVFDGFDNMTAEKAQEAGIEEPTMYDCFPMWENMQNIRIGFTAGADKNDLEIKISNYKMKMVD